MRNAAGRNIGAASAGPCADLVSWRAKSNDSAGTLLPRLLAVQSISNS